MFIHTGRKPYSCPVCPYKGNYKPNLLKHLRNVHAAEDPTQLVENVSPNDAPTPFPSLPYFPFLTAGFDAETGPPHACIGGE